MSCKRFKKGCHNPTTQRVSASPEPTLVDRCNNDDSEGRTLPSKSMMQQSRGKSSANLQQNTNTNLGKRKVRLAEPTTMDHVFSSLHHDSDSDYQHSTTPPPASSSRIDFNNRTPRTATSIAKRKVGRHIAIPSAFRLSSASSSFTPAHTNPRETRSEINNNFVPSSIQLSSSSTSFSPARTDPHETRPTVTQAPLTNYFPSSNQLSSPSISSALVPTNPPHENQPEAPICTPVRRIEHVNATMVTLYEALQGEIREAEEADRTRAMKMVNQVVRAADNALKANVPISVEDRARLDPELDRYRKMLATLQDRRVHRDRMAQERKRREQEHRDLLDDELLGRLGKR